MLSPKKQKFIKFIKDFTDTTGRPPTFIEIMNGLNFKSLGTVNWYIVELEKEVFDGPIHLSIEKRVEYWKSIHLYIGGICRVDLSGIR